MNDDSSMYQVIGSINREHGIFVVQHSTTKKIYVQKILEVYNRSVYALLQKNPIPNTPRIHDLYEEKEHLVLIEEYISGYTLEELLNTDGRFSEQLVITYMIQLCRIVSRLHACNPPIIHRDIKPSNIMINSSKQVVLLDFNAAKFCSRNQSQDTVLLGTHGYAAPEQYGFGSSGPQTDIYSIGILMNTLLAGHLDQAHITHGRLAPIIEKCTHLNPEERYASVEELQQALQQALAQMQPRPAVSSSPVSDPAAPTPKKRFKPQKQSNALHKYALPGFRSNNTMHMLEALLGYIFIILIGMNLTVTGSSGETVSTAELYTNRIFFILSMLAVVLCSCNYLNIHAHFFLTRSPNPFLRLLGIIILDALAFLLIVVLLAILSAALF